MRIGLVDTLEIQYIQHFQWPRLSNPDAFAAVNMLSVQLLATPTSDTDTNPRTDSSDLASWDLPTQTVIRCGQMTYYVFTNRTFASSVYGLSGLQKV